MVDGSAEMKQRQVSERVQLNMEYLTLFLQEWEIKQLISFTSPSG